MVWHLTKSAIRRWAERLLHVHDSPERTARAFAIGVVIGFSPTLGLHTALGLVVAFTFNLNRVAVLLGLWVNLPWFIAPFYALATAFGAWILRARMPADFLPHLDAIWQTPGFWARFEALGQLLRPLLPAYLLGSSILAAVLGIAAYVLSLWFLRARKALQARHSELP
ncbi:MAG: DUF2062 domain-containing protein [Acidobacteria bacterium]|nr:MAG: DUF2062 domain-containing protein [Acidobacteriota bacterium]